jgi:glucokinase
MSSPAPQSPWLLADVGGTHARFALAWPSRPAPLDMASIRACRVAEYAGLADAARAYLAAGPRQAAPRRAILALAGRIEDGEARFTNLAWTVSATAIAAALGFESVRLVNDFAAVAQCVPLLGAPDVEVLGAPLPDFAPGAARRTRCVLGPGTGLGVAALVQEDGRSIDLATEGGHVNFAPGSEEEIAVLRHLMTRFGRVSAERLLCGQGLSNLHGALLAIGGHAGDALAPEVITARARSGEDPVCRRAVELFGEMLGSFAGDCALAYGAWEGVFLAGGLLQPLAPWIRDGRFRRRFDDKGRFGPALSRVPVAVITHPQPGLLGAAGFAVAAQGAPARA